MRDDHAGGVIGLVATIGNADERNAVGERGVDRLPARVGDDERRVWKHGSMRDESHTARVVGDAELTGVERGSGRQQRSDAQPGDGVEDALGERAAGSCSSC